MLIGAYPFALLDPHTAYGVWRLRQEVFVLEQGCLYADLDGLDTATGTRHVVLQDEDNVVVGCARVLDELDRDNRPVWRIGRVVLAPSARGHGWSDHLMGAALQICVDVVLDAQTPLRGWYERLGFAVVGPEFLEDGIAHLPMRRAG